MSVHIEESATPCPKCGLLTMIPTSTKAAGQDHFSFDERSPGGLELLRALRSLDRAELLAARTALQKAQRGEATADETIAMLSASNLGLGEALKRQRSNWQFIVSTVLALILYLLSIQGQVSEGELDNKLQQVVEQLNEQSLEEPSAEALAGQSLNMNRSGPKVGRNHPCPCESGLKFKFCCGSTRSDRQDS
jgi:hypothetical protein